MYKYKPVRSRTRFSCYVLLTSIVSALLVTNTVHVGNAMAVGVHDVHSEHSLTAPPTTQPPYKPLSTQPPAPAAALYCSPPEPSESPHRCIRPTT